MPDVRINFFEARNALMIRGYIRMEFGRYRWTDRHGYALPGEIIDKYRAMGLHCANDDTPVVAKAKPRIAKDNPRYYTTPTTGPKIAKRMSDRYIYGAGPRLLDARQRANLTTKDVAKIMELNHDTIAEWERGYHGVYTLKMRRLSEIYGVSMAWLCDGLVKSEGLLSLSGDRNG